jgi:hypothetical protein
MESGGDGGARNLNWKGVLDSHLGPLPIIYARAVVEFSREAIIKLTCGKWNETTIPHSQLQCRQNPWTLVDAVQVRFTSDEN